MTEIDLDRWESESGNIFNGRSPLEPIRILALIAEVRKLRADLHEREEWIKKKDEALRFYANRKYPDGEPLKLKHSLWLNDDERFVDEGPLTYAYIDVTFQAKEALAIGKDSK